MQHPDPAVNLRPLVRRQLFDHFRDPFQPLPYLFLFGPEKSGKSKTIHFRWACDHEFRDIAQKWARSSLRDSGWATSYYGQHMARAESKSQACRSLANRWLAILWHLWQTRQPYDEEHHLHDATERMRPRR